MGSQWSCRRVMLSLGLRLLTNRAALWTKPIVSRDNQYSQKLSHGWKFVANLFIDYHGGCLQIAYEKVIFRSIHASHWTY